MEDIGGHPTTGANLVFIYRHSKFHRALGVRSLGDVQREKERVHAFLQKGDVGTCSLIDLTSYR